MRYRVAGSSPLARGLPMVNDRGNVKVRIIPARAGFTSYVRLLRLGTQDHPRSRGVYSRSPTPSSGQGGSSPLARGLPSTRTGWRGARRIIPARAGFTDSPARTAWAAQDHPRSRGVYTLKEARYDPAEGSSPLARGLPTAISGACAQPRIIPARAGFTLTRNWFDAGQEDHPRSRGVYVMPWW